MDTLENAKGLLESYNRKFNEGRFHPEAAMLAIIEAHALAAIAQAEQSKRIADAMEWQNELRKRENEIFQQIVENDQD